MHLDEALHQREPDAEAALGAVDRDLALREEIEDRFEHVLPDADAVVGDGDDAEAVLEACLHRDGATRGRELGGVHDEVRDRLLQPHRVHVQGDGLPRHAQRHLVARVARDRHARFHRRCRELVQVRALRAHLDLAQLQPRHVEQVVHQPRDVPRLLVDQHAALVHQRARVLLCSQQVGGVTDRGQRIAKLVRQHGEELVALAHRALALGQQVAHLVLATSPAERYPHRRDESQRMQWPLQQRHVAGDREEVLHQRGQRPPLGRHDDERDIRPRGLHRQRVVELREPLLVQGFLDQDDAAHARCDLGRRFRYRGAFDGLHPFAAQEASCQRPVGHVG